jgi:hypothetical protein
MLRPIHEDSPTTSCYRRAVARNGSRIATHRSNLFARVVQAFGRVVWLGSPLACLALPGDILGISISNGWMHVKLQGLNPKGTYQLGIADGSKFNTPTHPTVVLHYSSPGFTSQGTPTTLHRTNFATCPVRRTYPHPDQPDESVSDGVLTVRLALMDYTYRTDSNVVAFIQPGFYRADGRANTAAKKFPVRNDSTESYPRPIANWSRPPLEILTTDRATVALTGFGHHAEDGLPLQSVHFWAVDAKGKSSPRSTVSVPTIDSTYGDALPVLEYIGNLDLRGLETGPATVHFRAYPRLGDSRAVLDTSDGRFQFPTHEAGPSRIIADPNRTYGRSVAVVALEGSNTSGEVIEANRFQEANPPKAFRTIAAAIGAIRDHNGRHHRRADPGGGILYLRSGSHLWTGGPTVSTGRQQTWLDVAAFPGEFPVITGFSGSRDGSLWTRFRGITFSSTHLGTLSGMAGLVLGQGTRITNTTDPRFIDAVTNIWFTGATIDSLPQGFRPASPRHDSQYRLMRGCRLDMGGQAILPTMILGNLRHARRPSAAKIQAGGLETARAIEPATYPIIAFNAFYDEYSPTGGALLELWFHGSKHRNTNGFAIVQNLFEQTSSARNGSRVMSIASSEGSTPDDSPAPFALLWHNTIVGQRANLLENAGGKKPADWLNADRRLASFQNNLFEQANTKDDRHYNASTTGRRIGSFAFQHGINCAGNVDLDPVGMDNGHWSWSFFGIHSFARTNGPNPQIFDWPQFVRRAAGRSDGGPDGAGSGDYHLRENSPAASLAYRFVLPFDLDGNPRRRGGATGAFEVRTR